MISLPRPALRSAAMRLARRQHHPDPLNPSTKGWRAAVAEADLPTTKHEAEVRHETRDMYPAHL